MKYSDEFYRQVCNGEFYGSELFSSLAIDRQTQKIVGFVLAQCQLASECEDKNIFVSYRYTDKVSKNKFVIAFIYWILLHSYRYVIFWPLVSGKNIAAIGSQMYLSGNVLSIAQIWKIVELFICMWFTIMRLRYDYIVGTNFIIYEQSITSTKLMENIIRRYYLPTI